MTKLDKKKLEKVYKRALALEKAGELDQSAEAWREVLMIDPADHCGAAVRLAAMGRGEPPEKASAAYLETLFDQTAMVFDDLMVGHLGYSVPDLVRQLLEKSGMQSIGRVLDLGCGTGLTGENLRPFAERITGVDISEKMVEMAWDRGVYDDLYVAELVQFLDEEQENSWDMITATDVLIYFGDLEPFVRAAHRVLSPGGTLLFSSETLPKADFGDRDWVVNQNQRFSHRGRYIRRILASAGFGIDSFELIIVRMDSDEPVPGHMVLAKKLHA